MRSPRWYSIDVRTRYCFGCDTETRTAIRVGLFDCKARENENAKTVQCVDENGQNMRTSAGGGGGVEDH